MNIKSTVLISTADYSVIHSRLNEINQSLQTYRAESQVWLLIIKKVLYQREYDISLTNALKKIKGLHNYLTEATDKQTFKIKQDMMRQIGLQDNILQF